MPPVHAGGYLVEILFEVGPGVPGMAGLSPIGEQDLMAYQFNSQIRLEPWESRLLRQMSRDYCAMCAEARKKECPPPYNGAVRTDEDQRAKVDSQFRALLRSRKAKR
jgi:hypothetical protein